MERTYFDHFCELLNHNTPLDTYTANSFYYKLKFEIIPDLKSEISKSLISIPSDKTQIYLDYLLNEIEKQDYVKEANINYIQKHLDKYNVKLKDILDFNLFETNRDFYFKIIDIHYKSLQPFSDEKDEAFLVQYDFVNYFSKICADEIIEFINSKKSELTPAIVKQEKSNIEPFKKIYLTAFCNALESDNLLMDNNFILIFENSILHFAPYLQDEIRENLLNLDAIKQNLYVDYVKNQLKNTPFFGTSENSINHYLKKFNCKKEDFPEFNKGELYKKLKQFAFWQLLDEKDHLFLVDLQYDFFCYGSMLEAKKMIQFIDSLTVQNPIITETNNAPSTVSLNQNNSSVHPIFLNGDSQNIFTTILEQMGIEESNISKRGNQAKLHAIWEVNDCKEKLFKPFMELKDYTTFLNERFGTTYDSRNFSDGNSHHKKLKILLTEIK